MSKYVFAIDIYVNIYKIYFEHQDSFYFK